MEGANIRVEIIDETFATKKSNFGQKWRGLGGGL
jgi:hypothetical protein